jgi:hypothetical protein
MRLLCLIFPCKDNPSVSFGCVQFAMKDAILKEEIISVSGNLTIRKLHFDQIAGLPRPFAISE